MKKTSFFFQYRSNLSSLFFISLLKQIPLFFDFLLKRKQERELTRFKKKKKNNAVEFTAKSEEEREEREMKKAAE